LQARAVGSAVRHHSAMSSLLHGVIAGAKRGSDGWYLRIGVLFGQCRKAHTGLLGVERVHFSDLLHV
jgi:hypothetical protein